MCCMYPTLIPSVLFLGARRVCSVLTNVEDISKLHPGGVLLRAENANRCLPGLDCKSIAYKSGKMILIL